MCDYSLTNVRSRPAKVGDTLISHNFGTGTRGFCAANEPGVAVCVLPGTELAFAGDVLCAITRRDGSLHRTLDRVRLALEAERVA